MAETKQAKGFSKASVSFDAIPLKYRTGPVSPVAYVYVGLVVVLLFVTTPLADLPGVIDGTGAYAARQGPAPVAFVRGLRLLVAVYGVWIISKAINEIGWLGMKSYTMWSWMLMTSRAVLGTIGPVFEPFRVAWEVLRFPTLAMNTVTTLVWWLVIYPMLLYLIPPKHQATFARFNKSLLLVSVHGLNLVLTLLDHCLEPRQFCWFDLWLAVVISILYLGYYLTELDAKGYYFYIVLTPRTHFCCVTYSLAIALYYGIYNGYIWLDGSLPISLGF